MTSEDWRTQEPLEERITCSSTRCDRGLHCFRKNFKKRRPRPGETYRNVVCNQCGAALIDWDRLDKKDLSDVQYTFESLKKEMIRHHFWHVEINVDVIRKAERAGLRKIRDNVRKRFEKALKPPSKQIYHDGWQTPFSGDIIFYAQHSTSTCCRKCVEEWYGIDKNRSLTEDEMNYFIELIMLYIQHRLPDLSIKGE
jgi:hypothetical protein